MNNDPLLKVKNVSKHFQLKTGFIDKYLFKKQNIVQAVSNVSLHIQEGETLGLIGESGCGKSTLGRVILRLHEPTQGKVYFGSKEVTALNQLELKKIKQKMQIIFQDPYASLNPRKSVEDIIKLPLKIHESLSKKKMDQRVTDIIARVGLRPQHLKRYPHQFSGGQRQRIGIARALILRPEFVVCDEPVSALDVSIQAQIIQLMGKLKEDFSLTLLFISHDISVVAYLSDRIAVMYLGELVEICDTGELLKNPLHPYTKVLLDSIPRVEQIGAHKRMILKGDIPSPLAPPSGCKFHTRCPEAMEKCNMEVPVSREYSANHWVSCHLYQSN
ncbi:MAG: ATP-binding cassette domain-containing protein [Desulfobacula sp.]|uniref:ABC transporter ATP-binding protein n=1 Tax=Desulfobacula sp. TaxID=2593537 RepID=UPI0025BF055F|nr:oligopeptide/dipeptide ABC transporter ATP-binding protein [Desulfobacula sp.]MCD4720434.1 ATP-binding cassette domain-containing protein [Desulfobacula sp.]